MPRRKLSEFRAKNLLHRSLGIKYQGIEVLASQDVAIPSSGYFVVKVDQAIKKRGKSGLIAINRTPAQAKSDVDKYFDQGFSFCLVEPYIPHDQSNEHYLSLRLTREGVEVLYSKSGGVEIESAKDSLLSMVVDKDDAVMVSKETGINKAFIFGLLNCFNENFFSFLEINPLVIEDGQIHVLDMATEVDDATTYYSEGWQTEDLRYAKSQKKTDEEVSVEDLDNSSQASFRLEVLNPEGRIFMLLSGGGASVTLADEVYNQGKGKELANYGEYSGAPNREETMHYTDQILSLMFKSKARDKVLIIAGGIANFTDVKVTFSGIIDSLKKNSRKLQDDKIKIFVRRGGPNEQAGLKDMSDFINMTKLGGKVYGSEISLTEIISIALGDKS